MNLLESKKKNLTLTVKMQKYTAIMRLARLTATALQWLLFDKGLDGSTKSFNPVPLNEKNEENYELIPTVFAEFEIDGKITT